MADKAVAADLKTVLNGSYDKYVERGRNFRFHGVDEPSMSRDDLLAVLGWYLFEAEREMLERRVKVWPR